jgi:hypothetical protein
MLVFGDANLEGNHFYAVTAWDFNSQISGNFGRTFPTQQDQKWPPRECLSRNALLQC